MCGISSTGKYSVCIVLLVRSSPTNLHWQNFSIMPPGMTHDVFTAISSVMVGSHFLTYGTMPATELSMRLDKLNIAFKTNNDHPAIFTMVAQMTVALPLMQEGGFVLC